MKDPTPAFACARARALPGLGRVTPGSPRLLLLLVVVVVV